jgi:pimeloyl-ACP methyl ester carboxylesterase
MSFSGFLKAQEPETYLLHQALSKYDTVIFKRVIQFDDQDRLYHVKDYFEKGQIQMEATYHSIDKHVKEEYQCNYFSNIKEGGYKEWFENGQIEYIANYHHGLRNGPVTSWYKNGQKESEEYWSNGQLNGNIKYWDEQGNLQFDLECENGLNQNPRKVDYPYIDYLPPGYNSDTSKTWPLIIFLHGGSARGEDTLDLYDYGPFDQVYRGREFPFVIIAPQCPKHIRWSTDEWFGSFYEDLIHRYRIDTNRIYLTGASLGGSGTWYLAVKYPDKFAAIAPMCGFTRHMDYISANIERLKDMPVWAFHGKLDTVVPFEETEYLVSRLKKINDQVKFTREPEVGHWIQHLVYPGVELYDWFLKYDKRRE